MKKTNKQVVKLFFHNLYLKARYNLFKWWIKPIDFGTPTWEEDWNNPSYEVQHGDFYWSGKYIHRDCVELQEDGLHLKVKPANQEFSNWALTKFCHWTVGFIDYKEKFKGVAYGRWAFDVRLPKNSFAALWFLRYPHPPLEMQFDAEHKESSGKDVYLAAKPLKNPSINWWLLNPKREILGRIFSYDPVNLKITLYEDLPYEYTDKHIIIGSDHITPEIDLMEVMKNNSVRHTLHYGYSNDRYTLYGAGTTVTFPNFKRDYQFAVDVLKDKYIFYIDGIKTGEFDVAVYEQPLFPILNNAVYDEQTDTTQKIDDFVIKSVKYYKLY